MKNLKLYLFALLALPILSTSCKKDNDDDDGGTPTQPTCKTTKAYIYDQNGVIEDSVIYTYTGTQLTKLEVAGQGHIALEYANNQVTKRSYFDAGVTTATDYQTFTYNGDGTLSKIDNFENTGTGFAKWRTVTITYSGGKFNKATITEDNGTGTFQTVEDYTYSYNSANNVTGVTINTYTNGVVDGTFPLTYNYDTNPNYFTKQSSMFMYTDPFFGEFDGTLLPLLVSTNNASVITYAGSPILTFGYQTDSKGNVTRFDISGDPLVGYGYQCQ